MNNRWLNIMLILAFSLLIISPLPLRNYEIKKFGILRMAKPMWILSSEVKSDKRRGKTAIWKPIVLTAVAGGTTYFLYAYRTK
jgi:hypothetical protein